MKLQAYESDGLDLYLTTEAPAPRLMEIGDWDDYSEIVPPLPSRLRAGDIARRAGDIIFSAALLVMLSPLFFLLSLIVLLDSPGTVLFKQRRVGKDGQEFWLYKFRSMAADAEARRMALEDQNEASGPLFKIKQTRASLAAGAGCAAPVLDGCRAHQRLSRRHEPCRPRPALPTEVAQYGSWERIRLEVKPGITGLWQVSGRSALSFEKSIELDLTYVRRRSFWMDLTIILRTFGAVLSGRGAY